MERAQKVSESHWSCLAFARLLLASIVAFGHTKFFVPRGAHPECDYATGFAAMVAFLTISGFSIAASVTKDAKGFYARRVIRIAPVYYTCLFFAFVPYIIFGPHLNLPFDWPLNAPDFRNTAICLVLMQAIVGGGIDGFRVSWTLSIEVLHYAAAPVLRKAPSWALMAYTAASGWAYVTFYKLGFSPLNFFYLGGAWVLGFLAYRHRASWWMFPCVLIYGCGIMTLNDPTHSPISPFTYAIGASAILLGRWLTISDRARKCLNFCGDMSYPLYLCHWPAMVLFHYILVGGSPTQQPIVLTSVGMLVSLLITIAVDRPVRAKLTAALKARETNPSAVWRTGSDAGRQSDSGPALDEHAAQPEADSPDVVGASTQRVD